MKLKSKVKSSFDYAVKRGKCFTPFHSFLHAFLYWEAMFGGVLLVRGKDHKWRRAF